MSLPYVLREGIAGFSRARLSTVTAISALTLAVLLVGVLIRVAYSAYEVSETMRSMVEVEVFLKDVSDNETRAIRRAIEARGITSEISFVSKDSAAAIFREEFGEEGSALADLKFLPASFKLRIIENYPLDSLNLQIAWLKELSGIDEVTFNQQLLEILESRINTVVTVGGSLGLFVMLVSLFLVYNTIRLTIYARKKLIKAMKLVGATNAFIRRPFLVEGLIQGLVSATLACFMLVAIFNWILPRFVPQLAYFEWPWGNPLILLSLIVGLSLFMGWMGSNLAARKFIRETTVG
jgi:cell division transport system permease protein